MRRTRLLIYQRKRRKKTRRWILFALIIPVSSILIGYLISSMFILPTMAGK